MEAVLLPSLIGSGEKTAVYLEPVPLNSESEPPLTLISARVKSEEDSESSNSMRAEFKFTNDQLGRVGADCDGGRSGVRWRCNGEGERIIAVIAIFVEVTGSI